jgi:hypothetical protein
MEIAYNTLTPIQIGTETNKPIRVDEEQVADPSSGSAGNASKPFYTTGEDDNARHSFSPSLVMASDAAFAPPRLEKTVSSGTATTSAASSLMSFGEEDAPDSPKSSFSSASSFAFDFGARQCAQRCTLGSVLDRVPVQPLSDKGSKFDRHFEDAHACFGRRVETELARMDAIHVSGDTGGPVSVSMDQMHASSNVTVCASC